MGIPGDQTKTRNLHWMWDTHSSISALVWPVNRKISGSFKSKTTYCEMLCIKNSEKYREKNNRKYLHTLQYLRQNGRFFISQPNCYELCDGLLMCRRIRKLTRTRIRFRSLEVSPLNSQGSLMSIEVFSRFKNTSAKTWSYFYSWNHWTSWINGLYSLHIHSTQVQIIGEGIVL